MVRKTREEALKTRNQLLDAAEKVFYEKGFANTSLEDVAKEASVTRGAIYWHFSNKFDLFTDMVERVRLPVENLADGASCDCQNPLDHLRDIIARLLRETATNPRRRRVLTIVFHRSELFGDSGKLETRHRMALLDCSRRIEQALLNAVDHGQLPDDIDAHRAAIALHAYIAGVISNWLFFPQGFDLAADAELYANAGISMVKSGFELGNQPNQLKNVI